MGPHLCPKEQSGQAAEGLVPLLAAPTPFFSGAFLLGPELWGFPSSFCLPEESPLWLTNVHLGSFTFQLCPCFLASSRFHNTTIPAQAAAGLPLSVEWIKLLPGV